MSKLLLIIAFLVFFRQSVVAQFSNITHLMPVATTTDTKDKPQSKVWQHDGKFWAVLTNEEGTHVWRLDNTSWTNVLTLTKSLNSRADCKVVGNVVHIVLFRKSTTYLVSIEYIQELNTYKLWSERAPVVPLKLDSAAETATIDIDSKGRMWLASQTDSTIIVFWSDTPYASWSEPITLATGVNPDDIGAVVALPALNKIGVFWSNQNKKRFGFRWHQDGAAPEIWSADEVPAGRAAIDLDAGMADDHMNLVVSSNGTLYCAAKTSYDKPGYPRIILLVRRPDGFWNNPYEVSQFGTRGIVVLNEDYGKLRVVFSANEDWGNILYKETATERISFGPVHTLMTGTYNHPTSIKNNTNKNSVILASAKSKAVGVMVKDFIEPRLEAYPNPFHAGSTIILTMPEDGYFAVDLYNMTGRIVSTLRKGYARAGEKYVVDINSVDLSFGIYYIRLQTDTNSKTLKIIRN